MLETAQIVTDRTAADTRALLEEMLGDPSGWGLSVRLWDGRHIGPPDASAVLVLEHPWSLRRLLWPPTELNVAEGYVFGDVDVLGDVESCIHALEPMLDIEWRRPREFARLARLLLKLPWGPSSRDAGRGAVLNGDPHTLSRDRDAVRYHYDVPPEFFRLWLDRRMQYSCGHFCEPDADLNDAQVSKLDLICRKLALRPGENLLDIGCGWGGLLEHAATRFGARGLGVTLSQPQADEANARFEAAGVAHLVRAEVRDYREVEGEFDKIASVGMVEHVGESRLPDYFDRAFALLRPGGLFMNHGITVAEGNQPSPPKDSFVARYVFPDGELVPLSSVLTHAERSGFEVRDVEGLREHYARTLRHWVANLERAHDAVVTIADEVTYRIWRLYMAGSAANFDRGRIGIYQTLLQKPAGGPSGLPPTRAAWYVRDV